MLISFQKLISLRSSIITSYSNFIENSPYARLMRLDKPVGYILLMMPTWWVITLTSQSFFKGIYFCIIFAIGSIIIRSAGVIINDLVDIKIDSQVERTKNRPLASAELSMLQGIKLLIILLSGAFLILLCLPLLAIYIGIIAVLPIIIYPFMKRLTYFPQIFLGFTFNVGILIAWITVTNELSWIAVLLYISTAFWTIGYDTIYAHQDKIDDSIIGIKSMAIKLANKTTVSVWALYKLTALGIAIVGLNTNMNIWFFILLVIATYQLYWQIHTVKLDVAEDCAKKFKSNIEFAFIVFFAILIGKL